MVRQPHILLKPPLKWFYLLLWFASIISTPFISPGFLNIYPMYFLIFPYTTYFLYFGCKYHMVFTIPLRMC